MNDARLHAAEARVATAQPARYLEQLCKHFEHRLAVTRDNGRATIAFAAGRCDLSTEGETLVLRVTTEDPAAIDKLQDVVASHLARFAFREELKFEWQRLEPNR